MATKRHKPEEIVTKLRQVEVLVGQGAARVDAIREVHNAIQSVTRVIEGADAQLTGVVRITSTDTLCTMILPDVIANLMANEPALRVELIANNAHTDLGRMHADISVRPAIKLPEDLIGEPAGLLRMRAYAPVGMPDAPWLGMKGALSRSLVAEWIAQRTKAYGPSNGGDSFLVLKEMVANGIGKSVLPDCIATRDPRLEPVDVPEVDVSVPIWVATHNELATAPRLRSVRRKLAALIAEHPAIAALIET